MEAARRSGVEPILSSIRGGTDGSKLSYMGLLTPNIFGGGKNFHSRYEYIPVRAMIIATETIIHLAQIWVEKSITD